MLIAALQDVANVMHNEHGRRRQDRQRDAQAAARHPHRGGDSKRLQMIVKPAWDPATRKSITDMMERAVKAGFYEKMPDEKIIYVAVSDSAHVMTRSIASLSRT